MLLRGGVAWSRLVHNMLLRGPQYRGGLVQIRGSSLQYGICSHSPLSRSCPATGECAEEPSRSIGVAVITWCCVSCHDSRDMVVM